MINYAFKLLEIDLEKNYIYINNFIYIFIILVELANWLVIIIVGDYFKSTLDIIILILGFILILESIRIVTSIILNIEKK